jgi:DNA polymerase-3 subunit epsilon
MSFELSSFWRWPGRGPGKNSAGAPTGRWIVVDTETSGLDPEHDRLLAIGGVAVDDDGIVLEDSFEVVLQGGPSGNPTNVALHGIGHDAQAAGTPASDALAAFRDWCAGAPRVGFHANFDRTVLRNAFTLAGIPADNAIWLDLEPLAAALLRVANRHGGRSLDEWLAKFAIECTSRHNAASDALATAELLLRLRAIAAPQGARSFEALVKAVRQRKWLRNGN